MEDQWMRALHLREKTHGDESSQGLLSPAVHSVYLALPLEAVINPHAYQLDHKTFPEGRVEQCVM